MDKPIASETDLRTVYQDPSDLVREKSFPRLDKFSRHFLELSPFFCIGSMQTNGMGDVSPRGGEPGFVHALNDAHLAFPDLPGNNRLDTLTNVVHQPAVGLLFFLPGVEEMLRINGLAAISTEDALMDRFLHNGRRPRSVVTVEIQEVYFHCAKAIRRSQLWKPEAQIPRHAFPTLGQIAREQFKLHVSSEDIDAALEEDARENLY